MLSNIRVILQKSKSCVGRVHFIAKFFGFFPIVRGGDDANVEAADFFDLIIGNFREKIFERYYRIHHGRSTDVHGFGIGLSYVKQVVEAHEGVIRVESEVGVGTTFTVMIPLVKDEND